MQNQSTSRCLRSLFSELLTFISTSTCQQVDILPVTEHNKSHVSLELRREDAVLYRYYLMVEKADTYPHSSVHPGTPGNLGHRDIGKSPVCSHRSREGRTESHWAHTHQYLEKENTNKAKKCRLILYTFMLFSERSSNESVVHVLNTVFFANKLKIHNDAEHLLIKWTLIVCRLKQRYHTNTQWNTIHPCLCIFPSTDQGSDMKGEN